MSLPYPSRVSLGLFPTRIEPIARLDLRTAPALPRDPAQIVAAEVQHPVEGMPLGTHRDPFGMQPTMLQCCFDDRAEGRADVPGRSGPGFGNGPGRWQVPCAVLVLAALVAIVFRPVASFEFIDLDEHRQVVDNQYIRGLTTGNVSHILTSKCVTSYYPVRTLTFALDYQLWGLQPGGFGLTILRGLTTFSPGSPNATPNLCSLPLGEHQNSRELLEVDPHGFDEIDRKLLLTIIEKYQGGPVGVNTLAAALAEESDAIEEIYEPFLIQIGFLNRTPRGRVATQLAYEHFGITPNRRQSSLF